MEPLIHPYPVVPQRYHVRSRLEFAGDRWGLNIDQLT
jgi:hypothetical protein